ncbi:hypothetical protein [Streptomyces sp. NPDC007088]|uniref:SCO2195 family GlnR-regulated protein n=1 Tax=Streptomyces sp. NPDC007088 TaxID=3364773 RepID=UPI003681C771
MQEAPARVTVRTLPSAPSVSGALRAVEAVLLAGSRRTARRNAWNSVLEDRSRARDRAETEQVLRAVAARTS